jgi:hypothetical protein
VVWTFNLLTSKKEFKMGLIDNLNKIGTLKVINEKYDTMLKIWLVVIAIMGAIITAGVTAGVHFKIVEVNALAVPAIEHRLTVCEANYANIQLSLQSIDTKLARIDKRIDALPGRLK